MPMRMFDQFSTAVSKGAGKAQTFALACGLIVVWGVSGPLFAFSANWQLVVNTATTIVTFLMVFVLQHTQNRDGEAVQAKLDDLIIAVKEADNRLVGAEQLDARELHALRQLITAAHQQAEAKDMPTDQRAPSA
jgi:low affinity Fe/Cu permease